MNLTALKVYPVVPTGLEGLVCGSTEPTAFVTLPIVNELLIVCPAPDIGSKPLTRGGSNNSRNGKISNLSGVVGLTGGHVAGYRKGLAGSGCYFNSVADRGFVVGIESLGDAELRSRVVKRTTPEKAASLAKPVLSTVMPVTVTSCDPAVKVTRCKEAWPRS